IPATVLDDLQRNMLVFYTGSERSSLDILSEQSRGAATRQETVLESLHAIKEMGYRIKEEIERGDLTSFGLELDRHWQAKKRLSSRVSNPRFDEIYELAKQNGALGGKISGAGGGGFFVFYTENKHTELRQALLAVGLREMRYRFDYEGTKVMVNLMDGTF
ncbi:MAG: galactokinase, partial [Chloroflexota bacterium]